MLLGLSMFLWVPMFAQTPDSSNKKNALNATIVSQLEKTRIIFKDGSIRKNCKVKEIHDYWIVYEKEGSLHDLLIEKILRIEINDGTMRAIYFDERNKPEIRKYL
jgi:hypothetical protein